jgi:hydroxyacyl-ACP dehydratase HTD2-like protein with hotdog domain
MALDRSIIGHTSEPTVHEVERGAIRKFAEAIGDTTPACVAGEIAPPTFPTTFRGGLARLDLDLKRILHGGEEYEFARPIRAGDLLTVTRRVADAYEKEGSLGVMTFYLIEAEGRDAAGELVYRSRSTIIYR